MRFYPTADGTVSYSPNQYPSLKRRRKKKEEKAFISLGHNLEKVKKINSTISVDIVLLIISCILF